MNKYNESRPFLDKLEAEIAGGMPATKAYQMVLEYLDERDRERNELAAQVERLLGASNGLLMNRTGLDEWYALEVALSETPAQSLEAVKREWLAEFVDFARRNAEYGLSDTLAIDIDELYEIAGL